MRETLGSILSRFLFGHCEPNLEKLYSIFFGPGGRGFTSEAGAFATRPATSAIVLDHDLGTWWGMGMYMYLSVYVRAEDHAFAPVTRSQAR